MARKKYRINISVTELFPDDADVTDELLANQPVECLGSGGCAGSGGSIGSKSGKCSRAIVHTDSVGEYDIEVAVISPLAAGDEEIQGDT